MTTIRIRPALLAPLLLAAAGCATPGPEAASTPHALIRPAAAAAPNTAEPVAEPVSLAAAIGLRGVSGSVPAGGAEIASGGRPFAGAALDGGSRIGAAPRDPEGLTALLDTVGAAQPSPATEAEPAPQIRATTAAAANGRASTRLWPEAAPALEDRVRLSDDPPGAAQSVQLATIDASMQPILPPEPISPLLSPTALFATAAPADLALEPAPAQIVVRAPVPAWPIAEPEIVATPDAPIAIEEPVQEPPSEPIAEPARAVLASADPVEAAPEPAVVEAPSPAPAATPRAWAGLQTLEQLRSRRCSETVERRRGVTEVSCR